MKPIYAWDTIRNIWITGTVLNRPQSFWEPKTYLINVRGKVYKRTREHLKPRPTSNITNIPIQEILSQHPTQTLHKKRKAIMMVTANKESNTKKFYRIPTTPRERPPTSTVQKTYQLQSCTMRLERVTKITKKFKD